MGNSPEAIPVAALAIRPAQLKLDRAAIAKEGGLVRIGLVIDDLDPRRGGMSQWCCQFSVERGKRCHESHLIIHCFSDTAFLPPAHHYKMPRTRSRVQFAQISSQIVRGLAIDVIPYMGLGWHYD